MVDAKRIALSDQFWKFRYFFNEEDFSEDLIKDGLPDDEIMKVYVPSSWSYYKNRKNFYHFGLGAYETKFYLPYVWGSGNGKKISLVFNGVNYKTTVWINGKKIGFHEGGYTKFWFEINKFVKFGAENKIVILVDNRYMENRIPWYKSTNMVEWMNYGGIYRPVYLKLTSKICIDDYKLTNKINFNKPLGEGCVGYSAEIKFRFLIKDFRPGNRKFQGILVLTIENGDIHKNTEISVKIGDKLNEKIIEGTIHLDEPHLWCPDNPYLYTIVFQLIDKKNRRVLDRESVRWGIRDFHIHEKKFYLNNKPIVLRGINRHEDHPDVGTSMNPRLIYNDLNIMKEAHINCIITSHYPPYEALFELADEMGFLILEELPLYRMNKDQFTTDFLVIAQKQLWEMIHRDKNHCSVISWIISCECDLQCSEGFDFMTSLFDMSRELDPFRYHTLITNKPFEDKIYNLVDFVCINIDIGWKDTYDIKSTNAKPYLDKIQQHLSDINCNKPLMISKFGAGAIAGYKSFSNAHWSENYQYELLKEYLKMIIKNGHIAGAGIGYFQDFRCSPYKSFRNRPKEYNNKGIVDMHRNPKISYYIVQNMYERWKKLIEHK